MLLVIVGEFDSDNMGDRLIGEGHVALFSGRGCDVRVLPLEPNRKSAGSDTRVPARVGFFRSLHRALYQRSTMYRHFVESVGHFRRSGAYRARAEEVLRGADALVIGGGQLLSDGTLRMLHRLDAVTKVAHEKGIPVALFGTGMSSGKSFVSKRLMRRILGRLSGCSRFRDLASIEAARSVYPKLDPSIASTPDCAIAGIAPRMTLDPESQLVGIAPMSPRILSRAGVQVDEIDQWWIGIVRNLVQNGATPVLFSTGVTDDMRYAVDLQMKLKDAGMEIDMFPKPSTTEELLQTLGRMKRVLAQRLHASISFYALGGVPASASWDRKVVEFFDRISLSDRVFRVGEGDPEEIARVLLKPAAPGVSRDVLASASMVDAAGCVEELRRMRGV